MASLRELAKTWSILPVGADKRPLFKWMSFQTERATPSHIEEWSKIEGRKGWAVVTGAISGIIVIDFDGEDGNRQMAKLKLNPHVATGSGGHHVYFAYPGFHVPTLNAKTKKELGKKYPGVDIRGDGGYAVFLGANKKGRYRWLRPASELEDVGRLPIDLRRLLRLVRSSGEDTAPAFVQRSIEGRELLGKALTNAGGRNDNGFWLACQLRDNGFTESEASGWMREYQQSVPGTNAKGHKEAYTWSEARQTLKSAYSSPAREATKTKRDRVKPQKREAATDETKPAAPERPTFQGAIYELTDGGVRYWKKGREGEHVPLMLTNFPAQIVADVVRDDGEGQQRAFKIRSKIRGIEKDVVVGISEFTAMEWPIEHLGVAAIVYPNYKDQLRAAMQELAGELPEEYVYRHTGWTTWRNPDGSTKPVYLHANGAIGLKPGEAIVDLQTTSYTLPDPPAKGDLQKAVRASLEMVNCASERITLPLYAAIWRAPLGSPDCALWLAGRSGSGKSELAALAQQHYGPAMARKRLPANWESTANARESICYTTKDALVVVDDFAPRGSIADVQRMHREADRLLRSIGNGSGRQRMRADTTLRAAMYPRGFVVVTGEDVAKGHSARARSVILEMNPDDMLWERLTPCQSDATNGVYARAMSGYLQWLAPRIHDVPQQLFQYLIEFRDQWGERSAHKRTPDNAASLAFGLKTFLDFAVDVRAMPEKERSVLWNMFMESMEEAAGEQDEQQASMEPTTQFVELLRAVLSSGAAHIGTRNGLEPKNASLWGWEMVGVEWRPKGPRIGLLDDDGLFLEPQSAYAACQRLGRDSNNQLPISVQTLTRALWQRKLLVSRESKNLTVWRQMSGARVRMLHLSTEALYGK